MKYEVYFIGVEFFAEDERSRFHRGPHPPPPRVKAARPLLEGSGPQIPPAGCSSNGVLLKVLTRHLGAQRKARSFGKGQKPKTE